MKQVEINFTTDVLNLYNENYKMVLREIKDVRASLVAQ